METSRIKLTATAIKHLGTRNQRYTVRDLEVPALELRITPRGIKTYSVVYRTRAGKRERYTIGRHGPAITPDLARDKAKDVLAAARFEENPQEAIRAARSASETPTLGEYIADTYSDYVTASDEHRSGAETLRKLAASFPTLADTPLDKLDRLMLDTWRADRSRSGVSAATIRRDLGALKAALARAVEWKLITIHPLADMKLPKVDRLGRPRFLSDDEERRLRQALRDRDAEAREKRQSANQWRTARKRAALPDHPPRYVDHLEPMVLVSINTGIRQGELFNLRWRDVDLTRAVLTVGGDTAKSGHTRHVPLNSEARDVLTGWREQCDQRALLVFPNRHGHPFDNVKKAWTALLEDAGVDAFRWHDLRHHFASRLVMRGADLNTVRELLGHSDITMTLRYAHLADEHKANAVERLVASVNV